MPPTGAEVTPRRSTSPSLYHHPPTILSVPARSSSTRVFGDAAIYAVAGFIIATIEWPLFARGTPACWIVARLRQGREKSKRLEDLSCC